MPQRRSIRPHNRDSAPQEAVRRLQANSGPIAPNPGHTWVGGGGIHLHAILRERLQALGQQGHAVARHGGASVHAVLAPGRGAVLADGRWTQAAKTCKRMGQGVWIRRLDAA